MGAYAPVAPVLTEALQYIFQKSYPFLQNINGWLRSDEKVDRTFDKIQLILITLAMVFHTEGIDVRQLIDRRAVEETQLRYLTMLHRYLKDKYQQKADSKLANAVMMIHDAKEAHDLHKKRLPI